MRQLDHIATQGELLDKAELYQKRSRKQKQYKEFICLGSATIVTNGDDQQWEKLSQVLHATSELVRQSKITESKGSEIIGSLDQGSIVKESNKESNKEKSLTSKADLIKRKQLRAIMELVNRGAITDHQANKLVEQIK